jgi:hypothetical protein
MVLRLGETNVTASKWAELRGEYGKHLDALRAEGWLQWDEPPAVTAPVLPEPEPVRVQRETEPEPLRAVEALLDRSWGEPVRTAESEPAPAQP